MEGEDGSGPGQAEDIFHLELEVRDGTAFDWFLDLSNFPLKVENTLLGDGLEESDKISGGGFANGWRQPHRSPEDAELRATTRCSRLVLRGNSAMGGRALGHHQRAQGSGRH